MLWPLRQGRAVGRIKAFSKDFMQRYNIPTAAHATFGEPVPAKAFVKEQGAPIVIKADGLAAGKGVIVAQSEEQAFDAIDDMLSGNSFGAAGSRVVIEEFLPGREASFICLCDGTKAIAFASSQDHKARDDGDKGPNTGGMGAYSPAPVVTSKVHEPGHGTGYSAHAGRHGRGRRALSRFFVRWG